MTEQVAVSKQFYEMSIRPNQDVTGWLWDTAYFRMRRQEIMNKSSYSSDKLNINWSYPRGLQRLVEFFPDTLPNLEKLIRDHTRFPLYKAMLSSAESEKLLHHHVSKLGRPFTGFGALSGPIPGRLSLCPDCYEADLAEGEAFWHREFLTPGAMVCDIHDRSLLTFCPSCENPARLSPSNWTIKMRCDCSKSLRKSAYLTNREHNINRSYVTHVRRFLNGSQPEFVTADNILKAIRFDCVRYGKRRESPAAYLHDALHKRLGEAGVHRLKFSVNGIKRLSGALTKESPLRNPVQMLSAMDVLFEDLEHFNQTLTEANNRAPTAPPILRRQQVMLSNDEIMRRNAEGRRWLTDAIMDNPAITRTELRYLSGADKYVSHLRLHDRIWYEEQLPQSKSSPRVNREKQIKALEIDAANLVAHIERRYHQGMQISPPSRVTQNFVLSYAPHSKSRRVRSSPEVVAALKQYTEDDLQWRHRYIESACRAVALTDPTSPYTDPATYHRLVGNALTGRIATARKIASKRK